MTVHQLAGKPAPRSLLANIPRLMTAYYAYKPDISDPTQRVAFGTSGHRGSSLKNSFNEDHILAVSQAICNYRRSKKIDGPLFVGIDTHALSEAAFASALEVFAANKVTVMHQKGLRYTPTPVISHAILTYNRAREKGFADGVVITPSHNPPEDGGFKYNPPEGGPADPETTRIIEEKANQIITHRLKEVKRIPFEKAFKADSTHAYDYIFPYVEDLKNVIDMEVIAKQKLKIGADPLGGAAVDFFDLIAERYGLQLKVVNPDVDPTFAFMTLDHDGRIRMDCSSPYAMAGLIELKDNFDVAFGNDTDADRHGIVTKSAGLLNPNHYLSVAVDYLFQNRPGWRRDAAVGKTLVSTSMIERVTASLGRRLSEVPVGFKWFVDGLIDGSLGFAGEESAGASFLRRDGTAWTTDKDGIVMNLLACEMTAKLGKDPGELYRKIEERFGRAYYERMDVPASPGQKAALKKLSPQNITAKDLAGEPIVSKLTKAPGNNADIGGLKVVTQGGWFAARPSGTEDICKIYTESFRGEEHLKRIQKEAMAIVEAAYKEAGE
ncbi:MAG TPA: phosphoglucomutase (alpha-D-glucose-1,6-bisphosphate-dependent) [Thermodesulfobacteriota bacterium]|nr:phosphoglucomutase (alpha-D-glucose-1,6-bisphosphate-dependent) [Thermodesulfobacteriota bacterium]